MEKEQPKDLQQLVEERAEVARQITTADAAGETDKLDALHKHHEELTVMIEEMPNADELHDIAA